MINLGTKIARVDKNGKPVPLDWSGSHYYSNYPKVYIQTERVKIENLDNSMRRVLEQLNRLAGELHLKGFIITSGNDSRHYGSVSRKSLHYEGKAVDVSFKEATTGNLIPGITVKWGTVYSKLYHSLNSTLIPDYKIEYDIVLETNHIHIEYDPRGPGNKDTAKSDRTESGDERKLEHLKYVHSDKSITTLSQLMNKPLFSVYKDNRSELLDYKGQTTMTNRQRIKSRYQEGDTFDMIKIGTVLLLDPMKIDRDFLSRQSENQVVDLTSFSLFLTKIREEIENSPGYVPSVISKESFDVEYISSHVSVWVYSKSLDKIIEISPICNSINTSSSIPTSTFNLEASYIEGLSIDDFYNNEALISVIQNGISELQRVVTTNDIIWIRFEQLDIEKDRKEKSAEISNSALAGKYYDFIGLVDLVTPTVVMGNSSGSISISGQCLSKVLTDDEAIFFPLSVLQDSFSGNLLIGPSNNNRLISRLFSSGQFHTKFAHSFRNIKETLSFYINQLSNMGVLPETRNSDFFESYGDRRTKMYAIKGEEVQSPFQRGIYQIIKLEIDEAIQNRTVVDASVSNPQGSLMSLFYKVCQPPLVEFFFDTYRDTFSMVVRKPPFDSKSIQDWLNRGNQDLYVVEEGNISQENLFFENNFYTWFQIYNNGVFLGMDKQVALTYVPIVSLPEYVDLWGSKPLSVTSNYTVTNTTVTEKDKEQVIQDLIYLIESNAYLPFTRRGTIVLNKGDRRIKKGSYIEYERTGEVFYVEAVINSASISGNQVNRSTVLQVSRGMIKRFVDKSSTVLVYEGEEINYFNLVNLENLKSALKEFMIKNKGKSLMKAVLVNKEVFNFFLSKKQFGGW